jgi:NAD(P)-dependent dehydrogenase (short-subunit alcohol dehydrogenase family)
LDVRRLIDATVAAYGGLDILFNNAGIDVHEPTEQMTEETWDRVMTTNLKGHFLCAKYAIPHLKARGGGVIINMTSVLGRVAVAGYAAYCTTKAGIIGFTKALALELVRDNIRVNAIAPGSIDTPMLWANTPVEEMDEVRRQATESQPVGYIGRPEQIARAAVWLASREVDFMTGETLLIDGGMLAMWPAPV